MIANDNNKKRGFKIMFHLNKTKNMGHMSRFINSMFVLIIVIVVTLMVLLWFFAGVTYFQ